MQITDHIHALKIPFFVPTPAGPIERFVYVYLVCGEEITLIDSGVAGAEEMILSYLEEIGRPKEISRLILTHSHPDHIGAARAIRAATGCRVLAGAGERAWIEDTDLQARERPVPGFNTLVGGPVKVDQVLAGGEVLELGGGLSLAVIATPGHSAGSMSYLLPMESALFSGDAVPVRGDMPIYDDFHTSVATLGRIGRMQGLKLLLEAWQAPLVTGISARFAEGESWLQAVDKAVQQVAGQEPESDQMTLCRQVVTKLGLSPLAANPLVARSLRSHAGAGSLN
jgi:glyoxylase-like metal-dependent hydrolase (beta-lactamase superfamily II)